MAVFWRHETKNAHAHLARGDHHRLLRAASFIDATRTSHAGITTLARVFLTEMERFAYGTLAFCTIVVVIP